MGPIAEEPAYEYSVGVGLVDYDSARAQAIEWKSHISNERRPSSSGV